MYDVKSDGQIHATIEDAIQLLAGIRSVVHPAGEALASAVHGTEHPRVTEALDRCGHAIVEIDEAVGALAKGAELLQQSPEEP